MATQSYETRHFINGEFADSASGATFPLHSSVDPDGAPIAHLASAEAADVDRAVAAAKVAQVKWMAIPPTKRSAMLIKFADLVERDALKLAHLDSVSMGAPPQLAAYLSHHAAAIFRSSAGQVLQVHGLTSLNNPGMLGMTLRQPYGVVAAIIPWNVPSLMWTLKVAPAIAAGNAIVIKSSEKAPLSSGHLASLCNEVGFPPGLVNTIHGPGEPGRLLAEHMEIRMIGFTGSGPTGKKVAAAAALSNLKKVVLELGGKSPLLIFEDANLPAAIQAATTGITFNSGQACIASSRVFVHESIAPAFIAGFKEAMAGVKNATGDDLSDGLGPLADTIQGKRVVEYLEIGKADGKLVQGGSRADRKGHFIEPTIFTDVPDTSRINREEVFGPVAIVHTFKTEEEAIRRANDSEYGLAAAVFTENVHRAIRVASALESGMVAVNGPTIQAPADLPIGGYKQSGIGREHGPDQLLEWMETKSISIPLKAS